MGTSTWQRRELTFLVLYASLFYVIIIRRSLQLSRDHNEELYGLRPGWIGGRFIDLSDAQWQNFRGNLLILTVVFGIFTSVASVLRALYHFKAKGMSIVWLLISLAYLSYLHGACTIFILLIASVNFLVAKMFGRRKYFPVVLWILNISVLICNRVYEGYRFSSMGQHWAYLDNYRGTFRWHICFNFVMLRLISFGYDYHLACRSPRFDLKFSLCWTTMYATSVYSLGAGCNYLYQASTLKHIQSCSKCSSGQTCYLLLQEKNVQNDLFSFSIYLCYLLYAPLYIAGPILSFNAFASQLDAPQKNCTLRNVAWYGLRWVFSFLLMELMSHFFYYNAFAKSALWKQLSPMDVFIIGYGVLNFMWLKFFLIWRYFRFFSLVNGIEAPENMPKCINNCYNLDGFWKNWHASFNKWLVRYMYIPLGGSQKKLLNVWVIFTFVAIWHDLEWKLLSWAWLTCLVFVPEMIVTSAANTFQVQSAFEKFVFRELSAIAGAVTITCLMVANLVGYVIGPSGLNWLVSRFLQKEGLPTLGGMFVTFYVGTKLMFYIRDAKPRSD